MTKYAPPTVARWRLNTALANMSKLPARPKKPRIDPDQLMAKGIDAFDATVREPDTMAKAVGSAAGVATPVAAVATTTAVTGTAGGAAIMQTLALAGGLVGGGALAGIAVLGVASVAVGWGVTLGVKRLRGRKVG